MKNGAKRLLSLLLALVMACSLAVTPAFAAEGDEEEPVYAKLKSPGPFQYGTPLSDIIDTSGISDLVGATYWDNFYLTTNGQNNYETGSILPAGTYENLKYEYRGDDNPRPAIEEVCFPTFTITQATLSFDTESAAYLKYGYWVEIFADDQRNSDDPESGLENCLQRTYTATFGDGIEVYFNASWSMDAGSPEFKPEGRDDGKWYSFTASLSYSGSNSETSLDTNSLNLTSINSAAPKGYVRVYPVTLVEILNPELNTMSASAVNALDALEVKDGNNNIEEFKLGQPTEAIVYRLHEKNQTAAVSDLPGDELSEIEKEIEEAYQRALEYQYSEDAEDAKVSVINSFPAISTFSLGEPEYYTITGWKMGGNELTLTRIKAAANDVIKNNQGQEVKLTPIYKTSVPKWATQGEPPVFTLNISTSNNVPNIKVDAPKRTAGEGNIVYGEEYRDPTITVTAGETETDYQITNANGSVKIDDDRTISCKYEGVNGTVYGPSATKPTDAGQYRVVATLEGVGKWSSNVFTIEKYELGQKNFTGIICKEKVYDGNTNATLDTSKAKLTGLPVDGDADKITFTASGYFGDDLNYNGLAVLNTGKNVGESKDVAINTITLSGAAASNYRIPDFFDDDGNGTFLIKGKITPRTLTVNDKNLVVVRAQSDPAGVWTVTGGLTLGNVVGSEIALDLSDVTVSCKDNNVGTKKTVTLSGIKVIGNGTMDNYSLNGTGLAKDPNDDGPIYTYTFTRAEITSDSVPTLGRDFTVNTNSVTYDGEAHAAAYTKIKDGLGEKTVTYARLNADGSYATPTEDEPVDAGTYKVYVSFEKGNGFAAANNIPAGAITIRKAEKEIEASITVPAGTTKTVFLSELTLGENETLPQGARIMEELKFPAFSGRTIDNIQYLESLEGLVGQNYFTVTSKQPDTLPAGELTDSFSVVLTSDNYEPITVIVTVTVDKTLISIIPTLTVKPGPFYGDTLLSEIVEVDKKLSSATVQGTFALAEPNKVYKPGTYSGELIKVKFTESNGTVHEVSTVASFSILASGSGSDLSGNSDVYFTIYANSPNNNNANALIDFVTAQKPTHKVGGVSYTAEWKFSGNTSIRRQGYASNTWYDYTATLKDGSKTVSGSAKAHVRVVSVNAALTLATSSKSLNLTENVKQVADLGLPSTVSVAYAPSSNPDYPSEKFTQFSDTWQITGWKMDGKELTIDALKAKADAKPGEDVTVTLTPVYTARDWATTGSAPAFRLTISGKTLVTVTWAGPDSITYGETVTLDPTLTITGATISDPSWKYIYYDSNKAELGETAPTDAGTYYVNAVLVDNDEYTGESGLKRFVINPLDISADSGDITFAPPVNINSLTYNGKPHTPVYTVTVGETTLKEDEDYTVTYENNINAGTKTATVKLTGKVNYTGTVELSFSINPVTLTEEQIPTITGATGADGAAKAGNVLTASLEGIDSSELNWTWKVDDTVVEDNNGPSYEVKPEDSNKAISVHAGDTETSGGNYSGASGDATTEVEKYTVTGTVSITVDESTLDEGKIATGTVLTAAADVTPDDAEDVGTWKWTVDGVEVTDGVDGNTYTVAASDDGKKIVAEFTFGDDADYEGTISSAEIKVGEALLTGTVEIDSSNGTVIGCKLTASVTDGPEGKDFTYTWLRDGTTIRSGNTYTIVAADRGKTISVKATAEGYTGELSDSIPIHTAPPDKPNVTVTAGNGTLTIKWRAPSDNGGAPITGYRLEIMQGNSHILEETLLAANATKYTQSNLTNGTAYTVIVKAVNSAGDSEAATVTKAPGSGGSGGGGGGGGGGSKPATPVDPTPSEDEDTDEYLVTDLTGEDGSDIIIVQNLTNGSVGSTTVTPSGQTIILVDLPAAVGESGINGKAVRLPIREAYANKDLTKAPTVTLNSMDVNGIKVRIPIVNNSINVVAVLVKSDGSEELIKNTLPTKDGIMLRMDCWNIIKLYDNSKYFADTQDHWAADAVSFASSRELFNGTGSDTFSPNAGMTRGMLVTVLARYKDVDTSGGATWYEKGAAWAVENGLSDGSDLGGNITREQLATIMYRFAKFEGKLSGTGASLDAYTDADSVSSWAAEAMSWAVGVGMINGTTQTTLDPQGSATRAQVATIIMRYMQMFAL